MLWPTSRSTVDTSYTDRATLPDLHNLSLFLLVWLRKIDKDTQTPVRHTDTRAATEYDSVHCDYWS